MAIDPSRSPRSHVTIFPGENLFPLPEKSNFKFARRPTVRYCEVHESRRTYSNYLGAQFDNRLASRVCKKKQTENIPNVKWIPRKVWNLMATNNHPTDDELSLIDNGAACANFCIRSRTTWNAGRPEIVKTKWNNDVSIEWNNISIKKMPNAMTAAEQ